MKPRFAHKIHKPNGDWVSAAATDINRTFARIRAEQKKQRDFEQHKVTSILKVRRG